MFYNNLPLSQEKFFKIFQALDQAMHYCLTHPKNTDQSKQAGYFSLRDVSTGQIIFAIMLGKTSKENLEKYLQLSFEKSEKLYKLYQKNFQYFSSWQFRDPEKSLLAGAIRTDKYILSFSGLQELFDELFVLEFALTMGWCNHYRLYEISRMSNNIYYRYYNATPAQIKHWQEQR